MKVGDEVYIIDGAGSLVKIIHTVTKTKTHHKNTFQVKCSLTNELRLIHKDRVVCIENGEAVRNDVQGGRSRKLSKKKLEKFDVNTLRDDGILFKQESKKKHGDQPDSMAVETYCLISSDGTKQKYFNLYNGSLGKRAQRPSFTQRDVVSASISGDIDAISERLASKGYVRVF